MGEEDFKHAPIMAVGFIGEGEVLPPYTNQSHERAAKSILCYLGTATREVYKDDMDILDRQYRERHGDEVPPLVEVVGSVVECCVSNAINDFLSMGSKVLVNTSRVISKNLDLADFHKGRRLLQLTLRGYPERRVIISGYDFLFYTVSDSL